MQFVSEPEKPYLLRNSKLLPLLIYGKPRTDNAYEIQRKYNSRLQNDKMMMMMMMMMMVTAIQTTS
jgi:hypothetical protein